jgi:hypothetical protein
VARSRRFWLHVRVRIRRVLFSVGTGWNHICLMRELRRRISAIPGVFVFCFVIVDVMCQSQCESEEGEWFDIPLFSFTFSVFWFFVGGWMR